MFLELWDVGGSAAHQSARSSFYHSFHGMEFERQLTGIQRETYRHDSQL